MAAGPFIVFPCNSDLLSRFFFRTRFCPARNLCEPYLVALYIA